MWQAPNQRIRAIQNQRKREQAKARRVIHIRKVNAEIKVMANPAAPVIAQAQLVLNDFSPAGLSVFCDRPLLVGDEVAVSVQSPFRTYLRGRIASCQDFPSSSHVIAQTRDFRYRVGIRFVFENEEEAKTVRDLVETLHRDFIRAAA